MISRLLSTLLYRAVYALCALLEPDEAGELK